MIYLGREALFCTVLLCILAWEVPWTEVLAGLQSTGLQQSELTQKWVFLCLFVKYAYCRSFKSLTI